MYFLFSNVGYVHSSISKGTYNKDKLTARRFYTVCLRVYPIQVLLWRTPLETPVVERCVT